MDLFWPDASADSARNNLNVAIYGLRQTLRNGGPSDFSHIFFRDECYLLNPQLHIWVDLEEFRTHVQTAKKLTKRGDIDLALPEFQAAEAIYTGPFLMEDRYEEWVLPSRRELQNEYLDALSFLSDYYFQNDDYATCIALCRKVLQIEPCQEQAHRRIMRAFCRQQQHYLAIRQYFQCISALKEELALEPDPATKKLYEKIAQRDPI